MQGSGCWCVLQAPTAIRESGVTGAYLGLCPVLKDFLDRQHALQDAPPGSSLALAGIFAGLFAAVLTQPFDTAKTRMQAFVDVKVATQACSRCLQGIEAGGFCTSGQLGDT